jgi:hypothetical protein
MGDSDVVQLAAKSLFSLTRKNANVSYRTID